MRILVWSVHPKVGTGYGMGALELCKMFISLGHTVAVQSTYGNALYIDSMEIDGQLVTIYPPGIPNKYAADVVGMTIQEWKPDLVIQFFDIFVLPPDLIQEINRVTKLASILMIDSFPYRHENLEVLKELKNLILTTGWSVTALPQLPEIEMKKKWIIPIPISKTFRYEEMSVARQHFNNGVVNAPLLDDTSFMVSVVSANIGDQFNRKNFWAIIKGWKKFLDMCGNANRYLYLHTEISGVCSRGMNVKRELAYNGYSSDDVQTIIFPHQIKYIRGSYTQTNMRDIYNASDVYLNPAHGEGDGMPHSESLCCGTIPLVTNFGTLKEKTEICVPYGLTEFCLLSGVPMYAGGHAERYLVGPDEVAEKLTTHFLNKTTKDVDIRKDIEKNASYLKNTEPLWVELIKEI